MNIEKSITYVFQDKDWVSKLLVGTLLTLFGFLIVPALIVVGYGIQIARNVAAGIEEPLPRWDNWSDFLRDGFWVSLATFIYALPAILLIIIGAISVGIGSASEMRALATAGSSILILLSCISLLYMLALIAIVPAIYIQYIKHNEFAACMRFSEVIALTRANLSDILLTVLVVFGVSMVIGMVAAIPCLGWLIALGSGAYTIMLSSHLYGQIVAKVMGKGSKYDDPSFS